MEDVWKDISLASLQEHTKTNITNSTNRPSFPGMILQDFLARPFNKDRSITRVTSTEHVSGGGTNFFDSPSATVLSLNSGVPVRQNSQFHRHDGVDGTPFFGPSLNSAFDAFGSSTVFPSISKKRPQENADHSDDMRHKRMIKNRESAARSRARKQAYTNELEIEIAHLQEENAKLRRQQQKLLASPAQLPKKQSLCRTLTAPF